MVSSAVHRKYNWTLIENECPEYMTNQWDIVLALIAVVGFFLSCLLIRRFKNQLNGSVFLFTLAFVDMAYCLLYEYNYFLKSLALHFQWDFIAAVRMRAMGQVKMIEEFGNVFIPLLTFYIVFEKFLWTTSSRTRHIWRLFTVGKYKFILTSVTAVYAILAMLILTWNLLIADVHFCDVLLLPFPWRINFFRFLQRIFIPLISVLLAPITFIFSLVTLCRISKVGRGEAALSQGEEINLANVEAETSRLTTGKIKRSILCMLAIYFLFLVRGFCWFVYVNPRTTSIITEKRNSRIMRNWSYDFMNVVFSGSRMIVYYVFCRNSLVVDFPPNSFAAKN